MARSQTFDRRRAITALVRRDGIVSAHELRVMLFASPMTIRRDLDALERAGVLVREIMRGNARHELLFGD